MSGTIEALNTALAGRYRLEREVGAGGMATVYLAEDLKHHRRVAVKVLRPELTAALGAERFLQEIELTAGLQHPHILQLYDSGQAAELLFFVTPYMEGGTLRDRIDREGRLDVSAAIELLGSIADALGYAHDYGVVHRDIKPANVMLQAGQALLADFGIALGLPDTAAARLTQTGLSVGTPGYMSPEQAAGERELDARSDIYSLGALAYEMLAGEPPFAGETPHAALARALTEEPPSVRFVNDAVPEAVAQAIVTAMARDPEGRYASSVEFARALRAANAPPAAAGRVAARWVAVASALAAITVAGLWFQRSRTERWARVEAVPEIQRLLGDGQPALAFSIATRAVGILPDDPTLAALYDAGTAEVALTSQPSGARVLYRPYDPEDSIWTEIGNTPASGVRLPNEELLVRFELEGHRPFTASMTPGYGEAHGILAVDDGSDPAILVPAGVFSGTGQTIQVDSFWIDGREVTNGAFQAFVEAGGYSDPRYWSDPFEVRGVATDPGRMTAEFVDRTGRPGPAGWGLSRHAPGRELFPVQGVSWFEAVAYCEYRGGTLPTYYHWKYADAGEISPWDGALRHANIGDGAGPVPVATTESYNLRGVADLAGNVREWVWNESRGDRYVLGGSWQSPPHLYLDFDATDPWSRDLENGFRCARYPGEVAAGLLAPIEKPVYDFTGFEPPDDATFAAYAAFYEYDASDLEESRAIVAEAADWTREYVEFSAPYLDDRIPAHVFLPTNTEPPYQVVVYVPGSSAFALASSENLSEMSQLMFVPQSGRALVYPVLSGMYERRHDRPSRGMTERRQRNVWMVQDVMRTVDYIGARADLDNDRVAYLGLSYGAELAVPVALEKRFSATVLIGGALDPSWLGGVPDAAAPWNFVSRITTPTLLINGQYDFMHPYEESQIPFFDAIDVPESDKRFEVLDSGHVPPNNEVIGLALSWLDERFGPVRRVPRDR